MFQMMGVFAEFERAMIAERVRAGLARARSEGKRLGRPPIASALEKRIREVLATPGRPGVRSSPNGLESIPGQCSGSAALSPPQASPSYDREGHEMSGCRPATWLGAAGQRAAERLGRSLGKPEMF
jgi:resolvase-like protein